MCVKVCAFLCLLTVGALFDGQDAAAQDASTPRPLVDTVSDIIAAGETALPIPRNVGNDLWIIAAGFLSLLLVIVFLWGMTLRTRLAKQTSQICDETEKRIQIADRYRKLISNAGELIFTLSRDGRFIAVNPATERAFDAQEADLIGQEIRFYLDPGSGQSLREAIHRLTAVRTHAVLELRSNRNDDLTLLETAMQLEVNPDGPDEIQCIARDISERRRLESQVQHMQRIESIGQLAAGIAHDYNNLMTVVLGNSDIIRENDALRGQDAESLEAIQESAERAAALTAQLLAFSRRKMMTVSEIHPSRMLTQLAGMMQRLIGKDIELVVDVDEDLPAISVDVGMIEQTVVNLVLNARDAMPNGGRLRISAHAVQISEAEAELQAEAMPGRHVRICVDDTGIGIAQAQLASIFEPFFTTKEVGKGTGLGLSTVIGVVKQHDGWIQVESEVGVGSSFQLFLPVAQMPRTSLPVPGDDSTAFEMSHETILVVEDDRSVRLTMLKVLKRAGFHVIVCTDGPDALQTWRNCGHDIDLLITDMSMPGGISGSQLAEAIRDRCPNLRTIFCTGFSAELTNLVDLSHFERVLPKPFENKMLVKLVRELLNASRRHAIPA